MVNVQCANPLWHGILFTGFKLKNTIMSQNKIQQAKQAILNELTSTFTSIATLKANDAVTMAIQREELKQRFLLFKLSLLEA